MIDEKRNRKVSKFLSLVLRHRPDKIGLKLDAAGWADVNELMEKMNVNNFALELNELVHVVASNDKRRFAFNEDQTMIRASQGHSIEVQHGYTATIAPSPLYHGTAQRNEESIERTGLDKRQRHHVHLSQDLSIARSVGQRHGKPIVFEVDTKAMNADGFLFYLSENNVWLTEQVPPKYLKKQEG